jgi:hypothetical protein
VVSEAGPDFAGNPLEDMAERAVANVMKQHGDAGNPAVGFAAESLPLENIAHLAGNGITADVMRKPGVGGIHEALVLHGQLADVVHAVKRFGLNQFQGEAVYLVLFVELYVAVDGAAESVYRF